MLWGVVFAALAWSARPVRHRAPPPRCDLGFQFDPAASVGPVFALGGYAALQLKIRSATAARLERDAAKELARIAKSRLLMGELTVEDVEQAEANARQAAADYDEARMITRLLPGALLRLPDPSAPREDSVLQQEPRAGQQELPESEKAQLERLREEQQRDLQVEPVATRDPLFGVRSALGLQDPQAPAPSSLMPSGSNGVTIKDVAIGLALMLQVWGTRLLHVHVSSTRRSMYLESVLPAARGSVYARHSVRNPPLPDAAHSEPPHASRLADRLVSSISDRSNGATWPDADAECCAHVGWRDGGSNGGQTRRRVDRVRRHPAGRRRLWRGPTQVRDAQGGQPRGWLQRHGTLLWPRQRR